jgi:ABC-2 type transport system permease protein
MSSTAIQAEPTPAARLRWLLADSMVLARRNLAHVRQIPEKLIDVTLQPLMFVVLFAYVFGNVIHIPGGSYHEYLLGGIAVQTLVFGLMGPGAAIATDLREGIVDRFRSLPMARSAYLIGHFTAELLAAVLAIVVLSISGLIIGWGVHTDFLHVLAGYALLLLLAAAMIWIGTFLGVMVRSPDAVQGVVFIVVFPLTFVASAFVPLSGLPSALRTVGEYNPVSTFAAGVRTLFGNPTAVPHGAPWPLQHPALASVLWCLLLLAIFVPATLAAFRARTEG